MSGKGKHGVVQGLRRFFWMPRGTPRGPAAAVPLLRAWLFCLAGGALSAAFGWDDGLWLMGLVAAMAMLDDVTEGVRHRWPAFWVALVAGWAAAKLTRAAVPAAADSLWDEMSVAAVGTLAALATFVAISRLAQRGHS